ncbi:MAG: peptidoglycan editing factor PgeF [Clostridiales bacterium]|nr:peptidoglycan editing factor PgeF [Clostridiales bacterium]MDD7035563.1 peptidoglycan editing factor PgeF [Bacillota bacterium]MDY2919853.1 peptidoglycan editing factor PgeF [Lentihominibacter sp.]
MKYLEIFEDIPGIKAFFSTKEGAVEGSPYNNEELFSELGLEKAFRVFPQQVHEATVCDITGDMIRGDSISLPSTDGTVTREKNVLLTTVHADCPPVYFAHNKGDAVGMVHSGWRGTLAGICPQTVRRMVSLYGISPENLRVHIGPSISRCCFEVGDEVIRAFNLEWGYSFTENNMMDLKAIIRRQLEDAGVPSVNISDDGHCTYCEPEMFCSYRREGGTYMRMGAGICIL